MALNTWADVDPKAKRVTVYYEGTNTVYEGMLLHYNHDTTANWSGVDRLDGSESATTTEGSQNEGRWIRVEEPSDANRRLPAGVVAKGSGGIGAIGPSLVDIYVLNGATVPVYTDKSVTINEKAYMEVGQNTVINSAVGNGPCIGYFVETIDRSTAGLALCKLQDPDISDTKPATTLGIGLSPLLWGDCPIEEIKKDFGNGFLYEDDYLDLEIEPAASGISDTTVPGWVITRATAGGIGSIIGAGGELHMLAAATADQGINAQKVNACVLPVAGTNIWFEARVQVSHIDNQIFVGIADTDTTLIGTGALDESNVESVGFFTDVNSTTLLGGTVTQKTGVPDVTEDIVAMPATTWTTLGFKITGITKVEFYVDGVLVETGATAASIPAVEMAYSLVCQNEDGSNVNTLKVDWVRLAQDVRV